MTRIMTICALALFCATGPAMAAKLYLKGGGVITADRIWRSGDKVHVLINRDSAEVFNASEIDLRRTFPAHPRKARKRAAPKAAASATAIAPETSAAGQEKPAEARRGMKMPKLPTLPFKLPEKSPTLGGKDEGAVRKHNKETSEEINK